MERADVDAGHAVGVARQGHEDERGVCSGQKRIATELGLHARVGLHALEVKIDLRGAEELLGSGHDGARLKVGRDVGAQQRVHVVEKTRLHDRIGAAGALFARLEDEADAARQTIPVRHDEAAELEGDGLMTVMAAGVHEAGTLGGEAFLVGNVVGIDGFVHLEGVELDAERKGLARTARVERRAQPREAAHALQQDGRDARGLRKALGLAHLGVGAAAHVDGVDELAPDHDLEAERREEFGSAGGRDEFGPARFGRPVDRAPASHQVGLPDGVDPVRNGAGGGRRIRLIVSGLHVSVLMLWSEACRYVVCGFSCVLLRNPHLNLGLAVRFADAGIPHRE